MDHGVVGQVRLASRTDSLCLISIKRSQTFNCSHSCPFLGLRSSTSVLLKISPGASKHQGLTELKR